VKKLCTALVLICLVALPVLAATNTGWEIIRADYGSGNNWVDVTDRVRSLVQDDSLNFTVDGNTLGASARRGRNRALRLQLQDSQGRSRQMTFRDSQQVNLQVLTTYQSNLHINRAVYGSGNRTTDVTSRLNSQIQGGQLNILVNNQTMGGDPARSQAKTLTVQYALNGRTSQVVVNEGDTLRLPYGTTSSQGNLQINRAIYGAGYRTSDVTSRLNSQIQNNQLSLQVNGNSMGGDPAPGQAKTLTVQYALNGRTSQIVVNEGETLRLPYGTTTSQGNLQINRAVYGSGYRTSDVTSRLNSRIQNAELNLQVNNDSMGGDPAPGQAKNLTVQYALNGRASQIVVNEGDTLRLPYGTGGQSYGGTSEPSQRIRCESFTGYGRQYCPVNTRGGVRLSRRISNSECVEGSSWGYDGGGVWVDKGCGAEFEMQGQRNGRSSRTISSSSSSTIPNGTELSVRTNEIIDSKTANVGQTFSALIAADVIDSSGAVTIPKGSDAQLVIRSTDGGGITSASELVLDVDSVTVSGTRYQVSTGDLEQQGGQGVGANKKTAIMVGGGAAIGTLIGAIVGGGKGAAIGAAVGAAGGVGTQVLTRGKQVRVPAETLLSFRLDQDLRLQAMR
jgi:membrane-bound inhibitor of C-type lysozyme